MAGTKTGAKQAVATNLAKNPDYYRNLARKAGSTKVAKGYSSATPEERVKQGRRGGNTRWGNPTSD